MSVASYNRCAAIEYALKWALCRNPLYANFSGRDGDSTNFVSQCLMAGSGINSRQPHHSWYYDCDNDHSRSWCYCDQLHNYLIRRQACGPFACETPMEEMMPGDVIQIASRMQCFNHSLFISDICGRPNFNNILVCAHSYNSKNRRLCTYDIQRIRFLHIQGVTYQPPSDPCGEPFECPDQCHAPQDRQASFRQELCCPPNSFQQHQCCQGQQFLHGHPTPEFCQNCNF